MHSAAHTAARAAHADASSHACADSTANASAYTATMPLSMTCGQRERQHCDKHQTRSEHNLSIFSPRLGEGTTAGLNCTLTSGFL